MTFAIFPTKIIDFFLPRTAKSSKSLDKSVIATMQIEIIGLETSRERFFPQFFVMTRPAVTRKRSSFQNGASQNVTAAYFSVSSVSENKCGFVVPVIVQDVAT